MAIAELLHEGFTVLNQDVDFVTRYLHSLCNPIPILSLHQVWYRDPRPWLRSHNANRDVRHTMSMETISIISYSLQIMTALAPRWDAMGPANTG